VVVEEGPAKSKARKPNKLAQSIVPDNAIEQPKKSPHSVEEAVEDEEEDEVSEEEDDKFDIDDSSPEAAVLTKTTALENRQTPEEEALGIEKAREQAWPDLLANPAAAAAALHDGNAYMRAVKAKSKSRSRERSRHRSSSQSGDSGVDTPGRFAGPMPHPPRISHRHIEFADPPSLAPSSSSPMMTHPDHHGIRDGINTQKLAGQSSGKSRIPRDRDVDAESLNMKTPTVTDVMDGGGKRTHHRGHSPEQEHYHHHRAFAVWGHDESDSNPSDSDA